MKKSLKLILTFAFAALFMSSCNIYKHNMREANAYLKLNASDFELSGPVTGEATVTRILGIDWAHLFGATEIGVTPAFGTIIPYIGATIPNGSNYALYDLMKKNPGYDVVIYPQVESYRHAPVLGSDLYSKTTYKVTARLGKLK